MVCFHRVLPGCLLPFGTMLAEETAGANQKFKTNLRNAGAMIHLGSIKRNDIPLSFLSPALVKRFRGGGSESSLGG